MKTIASLLIVDDNSFDTLFVTKLLQKTGMFGTIYSVTDGAEALALFTNHEQSRKRFPDAFPPVMILLDINMPLMGGFEFLEEYTKLDTEPGQSPPVIVMLTSSNLAKDREQASRHPLVKDYVVKPITRAQAIALAEQYGS